MIRSEVRKLCAEMIEAGQSPRGELTHYLAKQAGRGEALAVLLPEVLDELERLEAAIRKHRDQTDDRRCWQDDDDLYAALPEGATVKADTSLPPEPEFLESCARHCRQFWRNRQRPEDKDKALAPREMTIGQLEGEVIRLRAELRESEHYLGVIGGLGSAAAKDIVTFGNENCSLKAEVERLRAERDALLCERFAFVPLAERVPPRGVPVLLWGPMTGWHDLRALCSHFRPDWYGPGGSVHLGYTHAMELPEVPPGVAGPDAAVPATNDERKSG
jgi:hypothetical protein